MHLFHDWREVLPNGKRNQLGVRYYQCEKCPRRRIDDPTTGTGYRGGRDSEEHWLATGEWLPPPRPPRGPGPASGQRASPH